MQYTPGREFVYESVCDSVLYQHDYMQLLAENGIIVGWLEAGSNK